MARAQVWWVEWLGECFQWLGVLHSFFMVSLVLGLVYILTKNRKSRQVWGVPVQQVGACTCTPVVATAEYHSPRIEAFQGVLLRSYFHWLSSKTWMIQICDFDLANEISQSPN